MPPDPSCCSVHMNLTTPAAIAQEGRNKGKLSSREVGIVQSLFELITVCTVR